MLVEEADKGMGAVPEEVYQNKSLEWFMYGQNAYHNLVSNKELFAQTSYREVNLFFQPLHTDETEYQTSDFTFVNIAKIQQMYGNENLTPQECKKILFYHLISSQKEMPGNSGDIVTLFQNNSFTNNTGRLSLRSGLTQTYLWTYQMDLEDDFDSSYTPCIQYDDEQELYFKSVLTSNSNIKFGSNNDDRIEVGRLLAFDKSHLLPFGDFENTRLFPCSDLYLSPENQYYVALEKLMLSGTHTAELKKVAAYKYTQREELTNNEILRQTGQTTSADRPNVYPTFSLQALQENMLNSFFLVETTVANSGGISLNLAIVVEGGPSSSWFDDNWGIVFVRASHLLSQFYDPKTCDNMTM